MAVLRRISESVMFRTSKCLTCEPGSSISTRRTWSRLQRPNKSGDQGDQGWSLSIFYIDLTPLSGHTSARPLKASEAFRAYYTGMAEIRKEFAKAPEDEGLHYLTLSGAPDPAEMAARTGTDNEAD